MFNIVMVGESPCFRAGGLCNC